MTLAIRPACPADAAAVAAIYRHHVLHGTATFDMTPRSAADMAERIAEHATRGWPFLVVAEADRVLGYAYAAQFRDRPAYAHACENSIYLAPDRTGQGLGKALLAALLTAAEASGFRQMIAVIGGGEPASVALHAALDFVHAGRMRAVGRKFDRWLDTVYMQRALGPGDSSPPVGEARQG